MKKYRKALAAVLLVGSVIMAVLVISVYSANSNVTAILDTMLSDEKLGLYSYTGVYADKYPELYNEILDQGEKAIGDLMIDFVNHPDEHRRSLVKNLVNTIVEQDEQISGKVGKMDTKSYFSNSEWFDHIGKSLYEKYAGIVDKSVMQRVGL